MTTTPTTPATPTTDTVEQQVGADEQAEGCACGGCGCDDTAGRSTAGQATDDTVAITRKPEVEPTDLDVRPLPPAQRHERILATVAALVPGEAFVLVNDHDPKPLRYQLDAEQPGQIAWEYLAEGPELWRVLLTRERCC
ncbi:DUF2249 domain-containing protein [Cellulomonas fimi]|uniref:DUF2249 domain-containing protein n=1 Tax=Cellulomonas fimi TaxID=1708 RepID=A0A7Y0QGG5_CELFI|nr:DUF2249 domain-containing protein [Cellulomonas fimi]NMR19068.1 DUF2249 domain-containing protein [Cellulomonas fimi]